MTDSHEWIPIYNNAGRIVGRTTLSEGSGPKSSDLSRGFIRPTSVAAGDHGLTPPKARGKTNISHTPREGGRGRAGLFSGLLSGKWKTRLRDWRRERWAKEFEREGYFLAADAIRSSRWEPGGPRTYLRIRWSTVAGYLVAVLFGVFIGQAYGWWTGVWLIVLVGALVWDIATYRSSFRR